MALCSRIVLLSSACTTALSAVFDGIGPGREVLNLDDACDSEGSCAVSALQISSRDAGAVVHRPHRSPGISLADEGDEWIFNSSIAWSNWDNVFGTDAGVHIHDYAWLFEAVAPLTSGIALKGCPIWMTHMMPMVSFWSQELRRRVKAQPDEMPPETQDKLRNFAKVAGWMICTTILDPRQGADFSEQVSSYWRTVASLPSTSLEVPKLDRSLLKHKDELVSPSGCPIWSVGLICDLGYITESLSGDKAKSGHDCWDKLHVPASYNGTVDPFTEDLSHPEYAACLETLLEKEQMDELCPMHGKYPTNLFGVKSWGTMPPRDSEVYKDVMQCQRKIGIPHPDFPMAASLDAVEMGLLDL